MRPHLYNEGVMAGSQEYKKEFGENIGDIITILNPSPDELEHIVRGAERHATDWLTLYNETDDTYDVINPNDAVRVQNQSIEAVVRSAQQFEGISGVIKHTMSADFPMQPNFYENNNRSQLTDEYPDVA